MSNSVLPIKILPHLIPFFYQGFEGIDAKYLNKKVKACKITMNNSLGFMIRLAVSKTYLPEKTSSLSVFIQINNNEGKKEYTAKMYKHVSGKNSFLSVPPSVEKRVNDILEDYFRIGFIFYVTGAVEHNHKKTDEAIADFMIKYELDEFGYNVEMLRRYYYRAIKKNHVLSRLQKKVSNKILNRNAVVFMS